MRLCPPCKVFSSDGANGRFDVSDAAPIKTPADSSVETTIDTGTDELLCVIRDRVAIITLNRPEVRNALSDTLSPALRNMIRTCGEDPDIHALLITGAGKNDGDNGGTSNKRPGRYGARQRSDGRIGTESGDIDFVIYQCSTERDELHGAVDCGGEDIQCAGYGEWKFFSARRDGDIAGDWNRPAVLAREFDWRGFGNGRRSRKWRWQWIGCGQQRSDFAGGDVLRERNCSEWRCVTDR